MQNLHGARARRRFLAGVVLLSLIVSGTAAANVVPARVSPDGLWRDAAEGSALAGGIGQRVLFPKTYRLVALDVIAFQDLAGTAPLELTHAADDASPMMTLPMPDGSFATFRIQESPVVSPALAARLPEVKTYRGQGIEEPTATARLDFTPEGFHGFIRSQAGTVYIDPFLKGDTEYYISYWRRDYKRPADSPFFHCDFAQRNGDSDVIHGIGSESRPASLAANGATLRTYRLALAGDGEYTQFHGGTIAGAQAAMVTTMNRVNGIYEQDLAVRMTMVDNTAIVFTDPGTDPYDNDSGDLDANQSTIDTLIGEENYDIGHLFGTGGGGVAGLGVVCSDGEKSVGLTGSGSPVNDAFDVDYVAHEMGHQFGAEHTFNGTTSSCGGGNRWGPAAYEPGSGSTIMAYAGICGSEDLQPHSDPYFHVKSYDEIVSFITAGGGNGCAVQTSTGNNPPTVNAGATFTIPKSTPFYLTGSATDPDDDPLTYCWEQFNLGTASPPNTDNGTRPIFRSFNPVTTPVRTFPKLSDLLANTATIGESLPTSSRTLTFRLTARDNQPGGGGVNYSSVNVVVNSSAGPFLVTAPNTAVTWTGDSTQTVTWNVASTTAAPVACANVKILLSTNGGTTFPTTVLASTPNDGTQTVTVPNVATTTARMRVECATSPFFDISNVNFTITAVVPAPTNVVATAVTTTSVGVTWTAAPDAVQYAVYRGASVTSLFFLGFSPTTSYTDFAVSPSNSYLYAVKSLNAFAIASAFSNVDFATPFAFTDPTLAPASTPLRAIHINELRTLVDAIRDLAGLSPATYTDPTLTAGVTKIKAAHFTELRAALDAARTTLGLTAITYTDPTPVAFTTPIKAVHVQELRNGVQ